VTTTAGTESEDSFDTPGRTAHHPHPVPGPPGRRRAAEEATALRPGARTRPASDARSRGIGYRALRLLMDLADGAEIPFRPGPYRVGLGRVGTMETQSIYAAVLACAERATVLDAGLNDVHALYHATRDALDGVLHDAGGLGPTLRTAALLFTIVRGPRIPGLVGERDWLAVAMFGSIGAPRSGWEHDAVGLGIANL